MMSVSSKPQSQETLPLPLSPSWDFYFQTRWSYGHRTTFLPETIQTLDNIWNNGFKHSNPWGMGIKWGEHYHCLIHGDSVQAAAQGGKSRAKIYGLSRSLEISSQLEFTGQRAALGHPRAPHVCKETAWGQGKNHSKRQRKPYLEPHFSTLMWRSSS